mmetsp:Transcript_14435/g.18851  ORF Transcript_14435/g.18851 Transcript_14435/m.18851 type:complete len:181 (+) Transcript_14435:124-666(+)|eukprot:CAMPEP_0198138576 /NCGR_PEP_ID=MMETSP1443-20131203/1961_1 /TAXON_ID=186043 /ORGANISM="Entomoneis sp., Strain CCMP2396" /LENGTH=180 /DNA_ID=CAMNT_0043800403 /DNA_START=253 /DNA_END=795 /DNA_ORIENTATION=-
MAAALPLTKLAGLLIKTLSKPLSKRIKHDFSRFQLTQRLLVGIGQTSHQITSRMTIWSAGYKVREIKPLETEKALGTGAEFVGESVIFLVSGGWIMYEYNQSIEKAEAKDEIKRKQAKAERQALHAQLTKLEERILLLEGSLSQAATRGSSETNTFKNISALAKIQKKQPEKSWWNRIWG